MAHLDALQKVTRVFDMFKTMDSTLPTQVVYVFLKIAHHTKHGPIETRRLPDLCGMGQASINRAIIYLSDAYWKGRKKPGLYLVEQKMSMEDRRQRLIELTPKGKKMIADIEEMIDG